MDNQGQDHSMVVKEIRLSLLITHHPPLPSRYASPTSPEFRWAMRKLAWVD